MSAWCDDDKFYDRQESLGQSEGFEPYDWEQPEATVDELCAAIDHAARVYQLLADETADLASLVARRVA